jgi:hypothetical protein
MKKKSRAARAQGGVTLSRRGPRMIIWAGGSQAELDPSESTPSLALAWRPTKMVCSSNIFLTHRNKFGQISATSDSRTSNASGYSPDEGYGGEEPSPALVDYGRGSTRPLGSSCCLTFILVHQLELVAELQNCQGHRCRQLEPGVKTLAAADSEAILSCVSTSY